MGVWGAIAKAAAKGATFAVKHSREIGDAANVAVGVAEKARKHQKAQPEAECAGATKAQMQATQQKVTDVELKVLDLGKVYEERMQKLECECENTASEISALKEDVSSQIQSLKRELQQLAAAQNTYQKAEKTRFLIMGIVGGIGIVASLVLACVL